MNIDRFNSLENQIQMQGLWSLTKADIEEYIAELLTCSRVTDLTDDLNEARGDYAQLTNGVDAAVLLINSTTLSEEEKQPILDHLAY